MRTKRLLLLGLALATTTFLHAQTDVDLDPEFGARLSAEVNKKLTKGLHLKAEEEMRLTDNFSSLGRLQSTLGITYKLHPNIKAGLGYALINPYSAANNSFKDTRHRLMVDLTGSYKYGRWTFSLKERFQATYRTGDMNEYQNPRTALTIKSRLKAQYRLSASLTPYAAVELRHMLNAPAITALTDGTNWFTSDGDDEGTAGWFISGWNKAYLNRIRATLGMSIRFDKHNTLNVYVMADRISDLVVDANKKGTKLKDYTRETGFVGQVVAAYTYSF